MDLNDSAVDINTSISQITFSWLDYVVFATMLSISGFIGIFFGCFGTKQNSSGEYLLGGKSLHILPVSMSIIASNISGMTILGVPADIYKYGSAYIWSIISVIISSLTCIYVYMPVFLRLEVITTYQYLHIRFDKSIKLLASFIYIFQVIIYNPVIIFIPCVAFSQATGYSINVLAPATTLFCVFYTSIGGLKTVVWTDTLQTISILLGSIVVLVMGVYQSGGVNNILQIAKEGERLDIFNFDLNPTTRDNFWTFALGSTAMWMVDVSINQGTLQRLSAVSTFSKAKVVVLIFCIISVILKIFTTVIGIAIYARYADCDPFQSGKIVHTDQVVPYYVMDVGGSILGLPGLFIAGIFAASLSTLSTNLLNLATTIYTDFLSGFILKPVSEKEVSYILKFIVIVVGVIDCGLVFLVGKFGGLLQFGLSLLGITYGTLLGLFTLGMVFPIANKHGALYGGIAGLIFNSCMVFGSLWYKYKGVITHYPKPISTSGCNVTVPLPSEIHKCDGNDIPSAFFRISFWYYPLYGSLVVLLVGILVSFITRKSNPEIRSELISPMFQFLLPKGQLERSTSCRSIENDIALKGNSHMKESRSE